MADPAYEHNGRPVARERFYALACDPRRSVVVEACAGAGKTWMLVSRIVRALLAGAQPHEILAITFTKKAAGEMRERLQQWLAEFAASSDAELLLALRQRGVPELEAPALVEPLRTLYARLLGSGRPVQIRTFHSWFAALLRNAPMAVCQRLGLPPQHELLEKDEQAVALVWRRFHDVVAQDAALRADFEAAVAAHGRVATARALHAALAKRVEFTLADQAGVVASSVQTWPTVFPDLAGDLPAGTGPTGAHADTDADADADADAESEVEGSAAVPEGRGKHAPPADPACLLTHPGRVWHALSGAARVLGGAPQPSYAAKGVELELALDGASLAGVLKALLTGGEPRKFNATLAADAAVCAAQALAQRLSAAQGQHEAWLHHCRMARLTRVVIAEYAQLKRDRGWVDMSDLERAALALLSDEVLSGWVQERLDARVSHLLIDEFQDTNPLQWQALHAWLASYAGAGGSAGSAAGGVPGLFIVGDPKQSIYRFRRAEPQVFQAAKAFVQHGLGGELLACDHTHRNAATLLAAVNRSMLAAQQAGAFQDFRSHTTEATSDGAVGWLPPIARPPRAPPRAGAAQDGDDTPIEWRDSLLQPRVQAEERLVNLESRQAARWIAWRLAQGLAPRQLMVLARKRDRLQALAAELRALGIPALEAGAAELGEAPEVRDLIALIDVLVSPGHDLSLARVLKSPLFSVPDDALVALAQAARAALAQGQPRPWLELLPGMPHPALQGVAATLARWKRWVERRSPHDALDAIVSDGDVLARYAQAAPPPLRQSVLANLRALLGAALDVGGGRYPTPYALVRAVRAGGLRAPALAAQDAVQLLTVHGAKGLEAEVVLLLDTDPSARPAESMGVLVDWPGEDAVPRRFAFVAHESEPPECCAQAQSADLAARQREELNMLYVAATRARRELVLSAVEASSTGTQADTNWWHRLQPHATPLAPPALDTGTGLVPAAAGTSFDLPVLPGSRNATDPRAADATTDADDAGDAAEPAPRRNLQSLFGQALHRLLELRPPDAMHWPEAALACVAREYPLAPQALQDLQAMALRMLRGEAAWAWDPQALDWAGNEVEMHFNGEPLRIDRLVRRKACGTWWVLDFKSATRPQLDEALREQLRHYGLAVQASCPQAPVQVAFVTGQGLLVRVD